MSVFASIEERQLVLFGTRTMGERICVAMSGGVDSSVAAALLRREGFEVVGCTLHLWDYPDDGTVQGRCCAPEDIHDARRVADALDIPFFAFDRRELFQREVVAPFVEDYLAGVTPSPCVRCNRGVKVKELLTIAERLSCSKVATGHYARTVVEDGRVRLLRAVDHNKDQSYFLHMLSSSVLERLVFPLGELRKDAVRRIAEESRLPGAAKGESQELCFVSQGRYDAFVAERAPAERLRPGPIVDESGREIARHTGVHQFTLGQRRNLGVAVGHRAYVTGIDADSGTVRLGRRDELLSSGAAITELALGDDLSLPLDCEVAVRYRGQLHPARVQPGLDPATARIEFREPVAAVVPGQVAVLYDRERVLGGGTISAAIAHTVPATRGQEQTTC